MQITINSLSALRLLRQHRVVNPAPITSLPRIGLDHPKSEQGGRWSARDVAANLARFGEAGSFSEARPLHVCVPDAASRLRFKGVKNTVCTKGLPESAFLDLGEGIAISSPELVFVEMAQVMDMPTHMLLGMELCGTFARDPMDPRNGNVTYKVKPATSVERLRGFVDSCPRIPGINKALHTLEYLLDNAWSPMEALLATMCVLPAAENGYDLWPLDLNVREDLEVASKETRVPDILFRGTNVGLNYDGEDHLPLKTIVDAAMRVATEPGNKLSETELEEAIHNVRSRSVDDKRRDRDLNASGFTVFPVTKEDLLERGALDLLVKQVIRAIERQGARNLSTQRKALSNETLRTWRQELIWSLMPGRGAAEARKRLSESSVEVRRIVITAERLGDAWRVVDVKSLEG